MRWLLTLILVGVSLAGCKSQAPVCDPFFGRTTIPPPPTGSVTGRPADPCYQAPPLVPSQASAATSPPQVQIPSQPSAQTPPSLQSTTLQPSAPAGVVKQPGTISTAQPSTQTPNTLAPRPSSTIPRGNTSPQPSPTTPSPTTPGSTSPYSPPNGSFDYRGSSTQGPASSPTAHTSRTSVTYTNVSATPSSNVVSDRMPRPVDDPAGAAAPRQPQTTTIQPRASVGTPSQPVDITDLPKAP
jgi:hypothetical protein